MFESHSFVSLAQNPRRILLFFSARHDGAVVDHVTPPSVTCHMQPAPPPPRSSIYHYPRVLCCQSRGTDELDEMTTLKEWFLMSGSRCCDVQQHNSSNTREIPPRILLLDGGVSTHLEEKLRQCRCCTTDSSSVRSSSSSIDGDNNDEYVFQYRELWSSSLLLHADGQQQILRGHLDWLQQSKVDVITTVTYQCHFIAPLWPQVKLASSPGQGGEPSRGEPLITNDVMNQMWQDGIRLAQQAVSMVNELPPPLQYSRQRYVVASSGCYGAALSNGAEYTGVYTFAPNQTSTYNDGNVSDKNPDNIDDNNDSPQLELSQVIHDFHRQKLQAILRSTPTVNGIAIETVPSYLECQVLRDLFLSRDDIGTLDLQQSMEHVACYVSLSCRNGSQLNDGSMLVDALQVFRDVPATTLQAIGLNCCSIRYMPNLLRILVTNIVQYTPQRGIVVFPNSGELWDGTTKQWYPDPELASSTPMSSGTTTDAVTLMKHVIYEIDAIWEELCRDDPNLRARRKPSILIGGCCRMTVETIAALRDLVDEYVLVNDTTNNTATPQVSLNGIKVESKQRQLQ